MSLGSTITALYMFRNPQSLQRNHRQALYCEYGSLACDSSETADDSEPSHKAYLAFGPEQ